MILTCFWSSEDSKKVVKFYKDLKLLKEQPGKINDMTGFTNYFDLINQKNTKVEQDSNSKIHRKTCSETMEKICPIYGKGIYAGEYMSLKTLVYKKKYFSA